MAGWGTLQSGGYMPDKLQSVKVAIYGHDYCVQHSQYGDTFEEESEFCAGKMAGGEDSCQGDSGLRFENDAYGNIKGDYFLKRIFWTQNYRIFLHLFSYFSGKR